MQTRQLRILNVVLALCAVALGWRLAAPWKRITPERSGRLPRGRNAPLLLVPTPLPAGTAETQEIVAKNLFTPDRGTAQKAAVPVQAPPLPVVLGTMNLGDSYEALMAEAGQGGSHHFRRVKTGEQFAGYTVSDIRDESVVVEFGGQKTTVDVYQSAAAARSAAPAQPAAAARPAAPSVVETGGEEVKPTPANTFPAGTSAAAPASQTALPSDVTVTREGNRERFERKTPFGPQVWYEEIPQ